MNGELNIRRSIGRSRVLAGAAHVFFLLRILIALLASVLLPALAAAATSGSASNGNPRLAGLQIEIWPEFDRPAAALVILKGEIAADVPLPAAVSLRLAASSGGPSAVAYSAGSSSNLLDLKYDRRDAGDSITLKFETPERFFHIEFYDPLATGTAARSYAYAWMGDLQTDRLRIVVQEPATASDFSVQPILDAKAVGQDGLSYRSADLGPFKGGKRLEVKVRYTKTDPRASAEILKPKIPDPSPLSTPGPSKIELAIWLVGIVALMGLGIWAAMMWWYGRETRSESPPGRVGFCSKCGAKTASGDRFCSKCGATLR